jgi:peptide/nickel transport system ATP-binding protein
VAETLLDVRGLSVGFGAADAVRDVSFAIGPGEILGLVGESGSGKSVTSLAVMRLLPETARVSGEIWFAESHPIAQKAGDKGGARNLINVPEDEMRSVRGARVAMIFQEPMTALNPVMRVGDQIAEAALAHQNRFPFPVSHFPNEAQLTKRISKVDAW